MILVTGATGMFGGGITRELARRGVSVRAMTRSAAHAGELAEAHVEPVVADMDDPATLTPALEGVETIFLVSPMDEHVQARELNVLEAARTAGVRRIVKLWGAVHHDDALGHMHEASVAAIKGSGLDWALLSPTSVMETTLLSSVPWIENTGGIVASSGEGRVALVAADDVARAGAEVLLTGHAGREYVITGPEFLTFEEMAAKISAAVGTAIPYWNVSDEDLTNVLVEQAGMSPEEAEVGVVCHFRAWRLGQATARTDTYRELTGHAPTSLDAWLDAHRDVFAAAKAKAPAAE